MLALVAFLAQGEVLGVVVSLLPGLQGGFPVPFSPAPPCQFSSRLPAGPPSLQASALALEAQVASLRAFPQALRAQWVLAWRRLRGQPQAANQLLTLQ